VLLSSVRAGETAPEDIELKPMVARSGRYVNGWLPGNRDRCRPP
jgi:hypothetical protein